MMHLPPGTYRRYMAAVSRVLVGIAIGALIGRLILELLGG